MSGTQTSGAKVERDPPLPLLEAAGRRLRDVGLNGATPWNDPPEERREARRRDLGIMRLVSVEGGIRLNEAMAGRLQPSQCPMFDDTKDPIGSLAKLNRTVVQIVLAEERLDESVEERAARVAAEAEARVKAERQDAAARDHTAAQIRRAETRRQVQHTVREITLEGIRLTYNEREEMLGDLFADLDTTKPVTTATRPRSSSSSPAGWACRPNCHPPTKPAWPNAGSRASPRRANAWKRCVDR